MGKTVFVHISDSVWEHAALLIGLLGEKLKGNAALVKDIDQYYQMQQRKAWAKSMSSSGKQ